MPQADATAFLRVEGLSVRRAGRTILQGVDLTLNRGSLRLLVGASGSGKTTLLRIVAGLDAPDRGVVTIDGRCATRDGQVWIPAAKRRIAMTFQDDALWPHMSVERHLTFGASSRTERQQRVDDLLQAFGLAGRRRERPGAFSGGERQRVGLARALAQDADLVLLDEPLAHVDLDAQRGLAATLVDLLRRRGIAAVWVTHRPEEALAWADGVSFLSDGRLEPPCSPEQARGRLTPAS